MENEEPQFIWAARRKRISDIFMPKVYFTVDFVSTHWRHLIIGLILIHIIPSSTRQLRNTKLFTKFPKHTERFYHVQSCDL